MKVLMLGWEYPPHISGGLGTACEGLTRALARRGVGIDFVVPHLYGGENAGHMRLFEPRGNRLVQASSEGGQGAAQEEEETAPIETFRIPSFLSPYLNAENSTAAAEAQGGLSNEDRVRMVEMLGKMGFSGRNFTLPQSIAHLVAEDALRPAGEAPREAHYKGDLFSEVARYTGRVLRLIGGRQDFELIHAHDWMTFPGGVALKAATGKPLIVHIHSLEYDRTGGHGDHRIEQIEREGLTAADLVIAVSYYTRNLIHERHGIPLEKIQVVHNGVYSRKAVENYRKESPLSEKIVLFLGRVTFQKGPDYFVEAAARVIPHVPDVLFVMAGSGDMLPRMVEKVNSMGLTKNFLFTGFLKGQDVERIFSMASLYIMPSVSEPFGIAALEAIAFNTPTIISNQSGVAEVLKHALKVDFWDVDQLAALIISALKYPELRTDMIQLASEEVRRIHWDASAEKTEIIYRALLGSPAVLKAQNEIWGA